MKTFHNSNQFKYLLIFIVAFVLSISQVLGQATIKGVVRDASDNAPLIAVNVLLGGTSTGTVTNYNGEYLLNVQEGTHVVEIIYLGYGTIFDTITISKGESLELNYKMEVVSITGDAVIVTAQARGQLGAVNEQVNSNKIVSVVSSERISEFPDDNAAQSLSRLPGVHLSGSQVVIRGIQPKMNKILINGVEMPSTEANTRGVSLDMISSNMLSGIEVFKTVTPDMDADAVGGVVNLRFQEAPEGLKYSVLAQGTYNPLRENASSKVWGSYSNRFLENQLGMSLNLNYNKSNGGYDDARYRYGTETKSPILGQSTYWFDQLDAQDRISESETYGGSLMLDYKMGNGKIIFNSMITEKHNNNLTHTNAYNVDFYSISIEHNDYSSLLLNNSLQFDQQIGRLKFNAAGSYISYTRNTAYDYEYNFQPTIQSMDPISNEERKAMDPYDIYDNIIDSSITSVTMNKFSWSPEDYNENRVNASLDLEAPFTLSDWLDIKIKTGGKYRKMSRDYDALDYRYGDDISSSTVHEGFSDWLTAQGVENWQADLRYTDFANPDYSAKYGNESYEDSRYALQWTLNPALMDEMALNQINTNDLQETGESFTKDYWGDEKLYAAYFMGEINLWSRLLIIPGVRYESLTYDYSAQKVASPTKNIYNIVDILNKPVTHTNLLPHLHTRLKVLEWFDVRFSFNKTLTRPDYDYLVPKIYYDLAYSTFYAGNYNLKPAVSTNYDLSFSFHSDKIGLITIGAFTKEIEDIFYSQQTLLKNIPDSNIIAEFPVEDNPSLLNSTTDFYVNSPNNAFLKGMEFEWQSNFSYLPFPFNGLVLNLNYTRVWSETDYPVFRVTKEYINEYPYIIDVQDDTISTNNLIDQAKDIGNISVGYDYKGFSARFSFRYQGPIVGEIAADPVENGYTEKQYSFDLAIKQQIPVKFIRLEAFFNVVNLTNVPYGTYTVYPDLGHTTTRSRYSGQQFQLGIRLRNKN